MHMLTWVGDHVQDNPHVVRGALVEGSSDGVDDWPDVRTRNESRVALENNAGFTSALAGLNELNSPTWPQVPLTPALPLQFTAAS